MQQVLTGQVGKYKIVKQLQKAVWLARNQILEDVTIMSVHGHPRVTNERDVLMIFTPRSRYVRPLLDEIVDPAEPTTIVLRHFQSNLLQASIRQKLNRTELNYVCRGVLEALAVMHNEGYVHAGVKADNILVNAKPDQTNRFTDVQLADLGNSYPETHEYALEGQPMGHPCGQVLKSLYICFGIPKRIFDLSEHCLIYGRDLNIFDPKDVPTDSLDDYKFAVLRRQFEIFGAFPVKYLEIANEDVMELVVWMLDNLKRSRNPFHSITDSEIGKMEKDFISWIMQLDPRDRPTAAAILSHEWWHNE